MSQLAVETATEAGGARTKLLRTAAPARTPLQLVIVAAFVALSFFAPGASMRL